MWRCHTRFPTRSRRPVRPTCGRRAAPRERGGRSRGHASVVGQCVRRLSDSIPRRGSSRRREPRHLHAWREVSRQRRRSEPRRLHAARVRQRGRLARHPRVQRVGRLAAPCRRQEGCGVSALQLPIPGVDRTRRLRVRRGLPQQPRAGADADPRLPRLRWRWTPECAMRRVRQRFRRRRGGRAQRVSRPRVQPHQRRASSPIRCSWHRPR
jgi:hypothetical protein